MYVLILVIFDLIKDFKIGTFIYDIDIAINSFDMKSNKQLQIYQVVMAIIKIFKPLCTMTPFIIMKYMPKY